MRCTAAATDATGMHTAAAALRLHAAGNSRSVDAAAVGFEFHQSHFPRNVDGNFSREMPGLPSSLPIAHDPDRVSLHVGSYLVLLELAAGILLRRGSEIRMNDIIDAFLLPAPHHHRAHVDFDSQILDRCQRAGDLLTPGPALAGYMCFLRPHQRHREG